MTEKNRAIKTNGVIPKTGDILKMIARQGVVIGSYAEGKQEPKDIDVIVKSWKNDVSPIMKMLVDTYGSQESPRHIIIRADPLNIDVFQDTVSKKHLTYRKAQRRAILRDVFGAKIWVYQGEPNEKT